MRQTDIGLEIVVRAFFERDSPRPSTGLTRPEPCGPKPYVVAPVRFLRSETAPE